MPFCCVFTLFFACLVWLSNTTRADEPRTRLLVLTDFYKDPDDKQSLIRLLTYADEFDIEGLIATSLAYGKGDVRPEMFEEVLGEYDKVYDQLQKHAAPGRPYPTPKHLRSVVRAGAPVIRKLERARGFKVPYPPGDHDSRSCDPAEKWIGEGHDTPASELIIQVLDRDDPRPVWIVSWGGAMDLAQAIWRVRNDRTPDDSRKFVEKIRLSQVNWQDTGTVWLWEQVPELTFILHHRGNTGLYREGAPEFRDESWVNANLREHHGPLGAAYPRAGSPGIKEGDTPSFLLLLPNGLNSPNHPEWGSWGGRFERHPSQPGHFVSAGDRKDANASPSINWPVGRWNEAIAHDFAARMDRCVLAPDRINHPPQPVLNGQAGLQPVKIRAIPETVLHLSAEGSRDPDGSPLNYHWQIYEEAGTCRVPVELVADDGPTAQLKLTMDSAASFIHVILAITDDGSPPLTRYRRAIVEVIAD